MLFEVTLSGVTLGGMYALVAMGLTLQYGVARIMNLVPWRDSDRGGLRRPVAVLGASRSARCSGCIVVVAGRLRAQLADLPDPADAAGARAPRTRDVLEVDCILATFGLLFVIQGIMLVMFGGAYFSYMLSCRSRSTSLGATVAAQPPARARLRRR